MTYNGMQAVALTDMTEMRKALEGEKRRVLPEQMLQMTGAPKRHLSRQAPPAQVALVTERGAVDLGTETEAVALETNTARSGLVLVKATWTGLTTLRSTSSCAVQLCREVVHHALYIFMHKSLYYWRARGERAMRVRVYCQYLFQKYL